jgi:hypothetical protein
MRAKLEAITIILPNDSHNEKINRGIYLKKFFPSVIIISMLLLFFVPADASGHTAISRTLSPQYFPVGSAMKLSNIPLLEENYTVTLTESGLPSGTFWFTTFDSTNGSIQQNNYTSRSVTSFSVPNGNYSINVRACTMLSDEYRAYLGKYNLKILEPVNYGEGQVSVNGSSISVNVTFSKLYYINVTESGLPTGSNYVQNWGIKIANASMENEGTFLTYIIDTTSTNYSLPVINGTWYYTFCTTVSGYHATPSNGITQVSGSNVSISVTFSPKPNRDYALNFTETGFLSGTSWSVTVNGTMKSSSSQVISFLLQNGSYPYKVKAPSEYYASPSNGTVQVSGFSQNISISFYPSSSQTPPIWAFVGAYTNYSGSITNNSKTVNGYLYYKILSINDTSQTIHLFEAQGNSTGPKNISNRNISWLNIPFAFYSLSAIKNISESPNLTINVSYKTSMGTFTTDEIKYTSQNLTMKLYIDTLSGIYVAAQIQNATIKVSMNLTSTNIPTTVKTPMSKYSVTFTEFGLSSGTIWSTIFNGTKVSSTTNTISFTVPNGTYSYSVTNVSGYSISHRTGSVSINGAANDLTVTFSKLYAVTFTESGLSSGAYWFITMNGSKESSTSSSITFSEKNGTYEYVVGEVSGYNVSSSSGKAEVIGSSLNITIVYTNTTNVKSSSLMLSPLEEYGAMGIMIVAIGGVTGLIIKKKR